MARLEFRSLEGAAGFAPLSTTCLDAVAQEAVRDLMPAAHSWLHRETLPPSLDIYPHDAWPGDLHLELMKRVNQLVLTEHTLWDFAAEGGYLGAVPYPVRYYAAAYLWIPENASNAWCLRCGSMTTPQRVGRTSGPAPRMAPVCPRCRRSGSVWPAHAVMPEAQGTWWLRCLKEGCRRAFVGAGQARFCPNHRQSRLSRGKRPSSQ